MYFKKPMRRRIGRMPQMNRYIPPIDYSGRMFRPSTAAAVGAISAAAGLARKAYSYYKQTKPVSGSGQSDVPTSVPRISTKKPKSARRLMPKKQTVKALAKTVRRIQSRVNTSLSTYVNRVNGSGRIVSSANQNTLTSIVFGNTTHTEGAVDNLKYFNPSAPGTLITADLTSATYMQDIQMNIHGVIEFRNNYQVPCDLAVYLCSVKNDTNITPSTAVTNGLADVGNPDSSSPFIWPTDSPQLTDLWKIESTKKMRLEPGQGFQMSKNSGWFNYDPSLIDSHALSHQKGIKTFAYLIRIQGVIGHDDVNNTLYGLLPGGVDYTWTRTTKVRYNSGGADITTIEIASSYSTITGNHVLTNQSVADNQVWSQS